MRNKTRTMKLIIVGTMATTFLCFNVFSQTTGVLESYKQLVDIQYRESKAPVYPQNAFHLDLYYSTGREAQRVIVFVHGGGWMRGDKSNIQKNPALVDFFLRKGYVVASINFRLPQRDNPRGSPTKIKPRILLLPSDGCRRTCSATEAIRGSSSYSAFLPERIWRRL